MNHSVNALEDEEAYEVYTEISYYCFSVNVSGLLYVMRNLGDKVRWPNKNKMTPGWKDKYKWCAYHEDFRNLTEDYFSL